MKNYPFAIYLVRFIGLFCILYYGTIAFIGLTAPGGYYSPFLDQNLNYISWLRTSLLSGAQGMLSLTGYNTYVKEVYTLQMEHGRGVHIGFDCLGYGVMSFWTAFIIANEGGWKKKLAWVACGLLVIWCINVLRIAILLVAINHRWTSLPGFDHHTWFNIAAYTCIFSGIYFYDRIAKQQSRETHVIP